MVLYVYQNKGIGLELVPRHDPGTVALGRQKPDSSKLSEVVYNGSAAYSPAGYIPQIAGMFIARLANLNNEAYVYIGRILNLLLFVLVTFFAIRIIPIGKKYFLLLHFYR
jgi:uncharacterized membrane protein